MLGGKTVIMAGVHLRGDLCRKPERVAEGEKEKPNTTAVSIGRFIAPLRSSTPAELFTGQP